MTDPIKQYVKRIERLLRLDKATRQRIMKELASDIQARQEAGATPDAIIAEMGTPEEVAAGFNAAFADHAAPRKTPLRWLVLLTAGVPLTELAALQLFHRFTGAETNSIGIIGGADGPTAIFVTTTVSVSAAGFWPQLSAVLALIAAFLLLQWPSSPTQPPLSRIKRLLPTVLACAAALCALAALFAGGLTTKTALSGLLALVILVFAVRRVFPRR